MRDGGLSGPVRANVAGPQRRAHRPGAGPGVPAQDEVVAGLVADRLEAIAETLAPICTSSRAVKTKDEAALVDNAVFPLGKQLPPS